MRSNNISSDKKTGIGNWTEDQFISLFHSLADSTTLNKILEPGDLNTVMPWTMHGKMKEEDLKAIFAYLKTVAPIDNQVATFTPKGE